MSCRAAFVWQTKQHFNRYIEDCGITCELVTPHMLAAPFYRGSFNCLIIPTGFANPAYSNLLPALRSAASRMNMAETSSYSVQLPINRMPTIGCRSRYCTGTTVTRGGSSAYLILIAGRSSMTMIPCQSNAMVHSLPTKANAGDPLNQLT